MTDKEIQDVKAFREKFNMFINDRPQHVSQRMLMERIECMQEELNEFKLAVEAQNLAEQADALVDLVYFAKGTAIILGLTEAWPHLWDDVQRANMAKIRGVGKRGHMVDCVKPEDWQPPFTLTILITYGYDPTAQCNENGHVMESPCVDDQA